MGLVLIFTNSCKKDAKNNDIQVNTVIDVDGNVYHTITIVKQVWMVENLKVKHYRNNDPIATTTPDTLDISTESAPKYQWAYDGKESNVATNGRMYTFYAINDSRGLCPTGWHVGTYSDWITLVDSLDAHGYGYQGSGKDILKSISSKTGWEVSTIPGSIGNNPSSNNSTGFTALPSGARTKYGHFEGMGSFNEWWTSTSYDSQWSYMNYMHNTDSYINDNTEEMSTGLSVRCIKD